MIKTRVTIFFMCLIAMLSVKAQTVPIPDENFLMYLKSFHANIIDSNDRLIIDKAAMFADQIYCPGRNIKSLEGIQYFKSLKSLDVSSNRITEVPGIANLQQLVHLKLNNNSISQLPVLDSLKALKYLIVFHNDLSSLPDLSNNTGLLQIIASENHLTSLPDLSGLKNLNLLDVGGNLITDLPPLKNLSNLKELIVSRNRLVELPDLKQCKNLTKLIASFNDLTKLPELASNVNLEILTVNDNYLYNIPDIAGLFKLVHADFQANYLTFSDFLTIGPSYKRKFIIAPQRNIPIENNFKAKINEPLVIRTNIDTNLTNMAYTLFFEGKNVGFDSKDSLFIEKFTKENNGYYYISISNPFFPELLLRTDSIYIIGNSPEIDSCPDLTDIEFNYTPITCNRSSVLSISLNSTVTRKVSYSLESASGSGKKWQSREGFFTGLSEPLYNLSISMENCSYDTIVEIPVQECLETFITPNSDGEKDGYYFSDTGKVTIYNKSGIVVKTLVIPGEWDGSSNSGGTVAPGYYLAKINDGKEYIGITILY